MSSVVELRRIGKTFPGVRALAGVDLAIEAGEVLGLIGENGAGKSTLIKILGGVYAAGSFDGEVVVAGRAQAFRSTADARRAGVAVVHQELALVPDLTVADNLLLGREPARFGVVDRVAALARARRILDDVAPGMGIDPEAPVGALGVGLQQIVEIARALADDARVVVLDEPTAALTEREAARLFELVRARRAAGTSFVFISHHLDEVLALCDRIAVLRDGELVGVRDAARTGEDEIVAMMTGKELAGLSVTGGAAGEVVLAVDELSVAHPELPGRRVVDRVSLRVRAGEIVALAGAVGAGRTALLSALFGLARGAVTGRVTVDGRDARARAPRDAIARGFALVPEDRKGAGLVLGMTVTDNLTLASLPARVLDPIAEQRAATGQVDELRVKTPGLAAEVGTLSGGNQQKVVLGKWLLTAPRVLLLDEPTRGVDVGAKAEIYRIVRALADRGHAVLMASSDLPEIQTLADRVVVLREGRVAGELDRAAATQRAIVALSVGSRQEAAA